MNDELKSGEISIFYRVLGHEDSLQRWLKNKYTTKHDAPVPKAWINAYYTNGEQFLDIELLQQDGYLYSADSALNFMRAAKRHDSFDEWTLEEQKLASLEAGVSAFSTPSAANEFAMTVPHQSAGFSVVEFYGSVIRCLPEKDGYIVCVVAHSTGFIRSLSDFQEKHDLAIPHLDDQGSGENDPALIQFKSEVSQGVPELE